MKPATKKIGKRTVTKQVCNVTMGDNGKPIVKCGPAKKLTKAQARRASKAPT